VSTRSSGWSESSRSSSRWACGRGGPPRAGGAGGGGGGRPRPPPRPPRPCRGAVSTAAAIVRVGGGAVVDREHSLGPPLDRFQAGVGGDPVEPGLERAAALELRQPAGPSRGRISTDAPSRRARSVASSIRATSTYGSHVARPVPHSTIPPPRSRPSSSARYEPLAVSICSLRQPHSLAQSARAPGRSLVWSSR
jgi:hypothetical protein